MSRDETRETRLKGFAPTGLGLEIAPYFNPMLTKDKFNVLYTDYISNEEIQAKAAENPSADGKKPAEIDFVWPPGSPLIQAVPGQVKFDFALASHVMEHVPNPLGWLNDILACIKDNGVLRLVLPNKLQSNDYFRNLTSLAQLIAWWLERPPIPTPQQVADFTINTLNDEKRAGFAPDGTPLCNERTYSLSDALNITEFTYNERHYFDVHCTVWTAEHFLKTMSKAAELGILNVKLALVHSSPLEFTVDLIKQGEPTHLPSGKIYPTVITQKVVKEVYVTVPFPTYVQKAFKRLLGRQD